MRRSLAIFNVAVLLLALYFPLLSPIASQANPGNTRFGQALWNPVYSTDGCYNDLMMLAAINGNIPVNSEGYPYKTGEGCQLVIVVNGGYPNGKYQFYGEGSISITIWPGMTNFKTVKDPVSGKTITTGLINWNFPALVPLPGTTPGINELFQFSVTDGNDPPTNFHLMRPDVPAYYDGWEKKNSIFGKEFLAGLKPYCCIRFINWMMEVPEIVTGPYAPQGVPTSYGVTTWASRPSPTYFWCITRTVAYENMIELCNELNEDMWICIPLYTVGPTPTDWCTQFATMVKEKLKPNLHVYYEIDDELWNYGWPYTCVTTQVQQWANANPDLAWLDSVGWYKDGAEFATLLMRAQQRFSAVLGTDRSRAILAGQYGNTIYVSGGLQYIAKYFGPPANYIYAIALADYIGGAPSDSEASIMQQTINSINNVTANLKVNRVLADQYGVKVCMYEGGNSNGTSTNALLTQMDPLMATAYYDLVAALKTGGADLCCWYNYCGNGFWSCLTDARQMDLNPPGSIEWQAEANIAKSCNCGTTEQVKQLTAAQEKALQKAEEAAAKWRAQEAKWRAQEAKWRAKEAKAQAEAKKHHH